MARKKSSKQKQRKVKPRQAKQSSVDNYLYVAIPNVKEFRRNILEPARDLIDNIKGYESLKALQEEKKQLLVNIANLVKELQASVSKIERLLPQGLIANALKQAELELKKFEKKKFKIEKDLQSQSHESDQSIATSKISKLFSTGLEQESESSKALEPETSLGETSSSNSLNQEQVATQESVDKISSIIEERLSKL